MPATPPEFPHDVFISYSHIDQDWVWSWLVPRLKEAGLKVRTDRSRSPSACLPDQHGERRGSQPAHAAGADPAYLASEWTMYEQILTQAQTIGLRQRTLPVLREPCDLPLRVAMLTYADLTGDQSRGEVAELDQRDSWEPRHARPATCAGRRTSAPARSPPRLHISLAPPPRSTPRPCASC